MNYNLLLFYLTELGSGNWAKFRQALEHLAGEDKELYPSTKARWLSMLGHVEFAFDDSIRWATCPPALAWLPNTGPLVAVLCGSRTEPLIELICAKGNELGAQINICEQDEGPDAIFVEAPSSKIIGQLASEAGLSSWKNSAKHIVWCLPSLNDYVRLCFEFPEPSGYGIKKFDTDSLNWMEVSRTDSDGMYWYDCYRPEYRLKIAQYCLKTTYEIGIYLLLKHYKKHLVRYDAERQELLVPVRIRLPDLFARVATLCSGLLPKIESLDGVRTYVYREVPDRIAHTLLHKLEQDLEI